MPENTTKKDYQPFLSYLEVSQKFEEAQKNNKSKKTLQNILKEQEKNLEPTKKLVLEDYILLTEQAFGKCHPTCFMFREPSCTLTILNKEGEHVDEEDLPEKLKKELSKKFPNVINPYFKEGNYLNYKERDYIEKQLEKEGLIAYVHEIYGVSGTFPEITMILNDSYKFFKTLYHESFHNFLSTRGGPLDEMLFPNRFEECLAEFFGKLCADNQIKKIEHKKLYNELIKNRKKESRRKEKITEIIGEVRSILEEKGIQKAKQYIKEKSRKMISEGLANRELNLATIQGIEYYNETLELQEKIRQLYETSYSTCFFATWAGFMKSPEDIGYCLNEKKHLESLNKEEIKKELENLLDKAKPNCQHIRQAYKGNWKIKLEDFRKDYLSIFARVDELLKQKMEITDLLTRNKRRADGFHMSFQVGAIMEDEGVDPQNMSKILYDTYKNIKKEKLDFLK